MKKVYTLLVALLLTATVWAQSPEKINYQAVIRDANSALVTTQAVGMQISILQGSASGTAVYIETQTPTTNANGLVSLEIGSGTVVSGDFTTIDWSTGSYFINTETDPTGGSTYTISGTSQLLSVPYALYAEKAGTVELTSEQVALLQGEQGIAGADGQDGLTTTVNGVEQVDGEITLTKSDLGLGNVDNTGDQDISGIATNAQAVKDTAAQIRADMPASISDLAMNANAQKITNLADPIDAQDAATKAYVDALLARIESLEEPGSFTDTRDGNHYDVVEIGNQIWMAENLAYLPSVNAPADGSEDAAGSYYYVYGYDGTDTAAAKATSNYDTYGVLYNWTAAMAGSASSSSNPSGIQGVCPTGWHLPSDAEWTELTDFLGGTSVAGGKLKEGGETGFTALLGGYRYSRGAFDDIGEFGLWWSATEYNASYAWIRIMYYDTSRVGRDYYNKETGYSVRCVRD